MIHYIPVPVVQDDTCPKCHIADHRIEVCKACGHEYSDSEGLEWWERAILWGVAALCVGVMAVGVFNEILRSSISQ